MPPNPQTGLPGLTTSRHRIAMVVPFTFGLEEPRRLAAFDDLILRRTAFDATGVAESTLRGQAPEPSRWQAYAGARNDRPESEETVNPAYYSLYPQAQQVVHNALRPPDDAPRADALLCLPYSMPLAGLRIPAGEGFTGDEDLALDSARLLLFRTGVGVLAVIFEVGSGPVPATRLLDALRGLAEPHNCPSGRPQARQARRLDRLAETLLRHAMGEAARPHPYRKTWISAARVPASDRAVIERLALLLGHRQTSAYAIRHEYVQDAVYAPFAYVGHAVSIGGAASVVADHPEAQGFVDIFVDRVWSHTYLPLLMLPLHQHYFYLRHTEWEPLSPEARAAVKRLEERFEQNLDFQAYFGSSLVGQIDLHNAYVRTATQHLRLGERSAEYERATRDYAAMLKARRQRKLRWMEIFGSAGAVFLLMRELLEALMQNGFIGDVPDSRAWFAMLHRWTPEETTRMVDRLHHWEQTILIVSLAFAVAAGAIAWAFDRRLGKD